MSVFRILVDQNRPFAQVLEERDGGDSLVVSYVYGDDLISQQRGVADSFYHYDGLGSARALTDGTEAVRNFRKKNCKAQDGSDKQVFVDANGNEMDIDEINESNKHIRI